jgi:predicted ribosome quality control (RQC) complex YloA/Tae2 family protein
MLSLVELERVAAVVTRRWVGGRVERWVEPCPGRLCFSLYRRDGDVQRKAVLDLDARPEVAHLGELPRMPAAPDQLPAFSAYLRAHLSRARLEAAALRGGDRQLSLRFSAESGEFDLLLSLFGRRSNVYLLDEQGRILQALRPLRETRSELALQQPFVDPASGPPRVGSDRFAEVADDDLLAAIAAHYSGEQATQSTDDERRILLAILAKERKAAVRRIERIEAELREAEEVAALERHGELLKSNLARVAPGARSVTVSDFESGAPVEIPLDPRLSAKGNLEAIFKRYQKLIRRLSKAGGQIDAARASLESLDRLAAEIEAIEIGSPEAGKEGAAPAGEVPSRAAPGADSAASAETDGAARWRALLAREEVRRLLGRSGQEMAARGGTTAPRREGGAGAASGTEVLRGPALPAAYRDQPRKLHPRRYRTAGGLEIWVGRSDEANDFLTTRLARGKDLFFHLAGAPGSHVILRTEGRDDPPSEAVLDACELAVHFSKQKNAGSAEVHVVPIKNVKKPRGAKPGLVYVTGGRSLHLRRESSRLERVLSARIGD